MRLFSARRPTIAVLMLAVAAFAVLAAVSRQGATILIAWIGMGVCLAAALVLAVTLVRR